MSFSVSADKGIWKGFILITNSSGNNLSAAPSTLVEAYVNGAWKSYAWTSQTPGPGAYGIVVEGNLGDTVIFKVWGSSTDNSTPIDFTPGVHPSDSPTSWFNLTFTELANSAACNNSNACSGGYCCSGGTEILNNASSGTCQASACSSSSSSSSSSGGGGGGGGGGSASTTVSETQSVTGTVSAGATASFSLTKAADTGISSIDVSTASAVTNPQITVKQSSLSTGQSSAISSSSGSVYHYLSITKTNMKDADISNAKVKFQVNKTWVANNGIDYKTIALSRYSNNTWSKMPTTYSKDDATYYYYESNVPGFSLFAITGEKKTSYTAFEVIDIIRNFYSGKSSYSAFDIIDIIRKFYAGG